MRKDFDPTCIADPDIRQGVRALRNLAESHFEQIRLLHEQIARLKGQ